ncbi:MAG: AraC family transcriptional regulator [Ruminococcaceae bacterium]|nr:AraC family transcriptional regulator [Oscillospiraceae bacterium]
MAMDSEFKKYCYDDNPHYRIHHTVEYNTPHTNPAHLHYDLSLVLTYFKKGRGDITIDGVHYEIEAGDIILLNPYELHCCTVDNDVYHERIALYIYETILSPFQCENVGFFKAFYERENGYGNRIPAEAVISSGSAEKLEHVLELTKKGDEESIVLAKCAIIELLSLINHSLVPYMQTDLPPNAKNSTVESILKYLNQNFTEDIKLEDIASKFYISKYHLCRIFREHVGATLWEYVTFRRLMAFNDLVRKKCSLEDAAYKVGFRNYSNFYRLYKKYMKFTPSQFKQQLKASGGKSDSLSFRNESKDAATDRESDGVDFLINDYFSNKN